MHESFEYSRRCYRSEVRIDCVECLRAVALRMRSKPDPEREENPSFSGQRATPYKVRG